LQARRSRGETITPFVLSQEAEAGDELAATIILETAKYLGVGVVSLLHTIDPAIVVIGGAMTWGGHDTATGRAFLQAVRDEVRLRAFPTPAAQTRIDYASLGGDAGYLGAAGLARSALHKAAGNSAVGQAVSAAEAS
jgi:glucokinase